jgi:hypothetical protein
MEATYGTYKAYLDFQQSYVPDVDVHLRIPASYQDVPEPNYDWGPIVVDLANQFRGDFSQCAKIFVTLAELAKTVQMITNPFGLLKPNWRKTAGLKTASQLANKGVSLWLEYRYGWRPLLYELSLYANSYNKYRAAVRNNGLEADQHRFSKHAELSVSLPDGWDEIQYVGCTAGQWNSLSSGGWYEHSTSKPVIARLRTMQGKGTARVGCRSRMHASDQFSRSKTALQVLGATTRDILPTLWEVVPYSFVVDWFINWQGWIDLSRSRRLLQSAACSDLGYSWKVEYPYRMDVYPTPYLIGLAGSTYKYKTLNGVVPIDKSSSVGTAKKYSRVCGLPNTSLEDFCSTDLSFIHMVDGAGLIISRLFH